MLAARTAAAKKQRDEMKAGLERRKLEEEAKAKRKKETRASELAARRRAR